MAMVYGVCKQDKETTVWAHAPSQFKGWALKSPDHWGAWLCSDCHDWLDGRVLGGSKTEKLKYWWASVQRTQKKLIEMGILRVG